MVWTTWIAVAAVIVTVWALIKRYETRLVLLAAGLFMCVVSMQPMMALNQFAKSMTSSTLIMAICSAMGFAAIISATKCDSHLVTLLTRPLQKLGLMLLPACMLVTSIVAVAIPSNSGLIAAVGPTIMPLLIRAGFKPAMAAAAVVGAIMPAYFNPGVSHNPFLAKMCDMEVVEFIGMFSTQLLIISGGAIVLITLTAFIMRDYQPKSVIKAAIKDDTKEEDKVEKVNLLYALAPIFPVVLLLLGNTVLPQIKMGVAQAMLLGAVFCLIVTRTNPESATKAFFNGMGKGYGSILGIIIAAGVFAAGLRACGVIDLFVNYLTHSNEVARLGGLLGPAFMALMTGSGDAAAFAFNESVTPHAAEFGLQIPNLGMLAVISGGLGRMMSPLAGGMILAAGMAGVDPIQVVKRTAPAALILLVVVYFIY